MRTPTDALRALRLRIPAIAYGDTRSFRRPAAVARIARIVLAATILGLLAGSAVVAARASGPRSEIVPETQANVVVIDVSKSIIEREFAMIGVTLRRLIATDTPTGLIVFSDVAYELLPPGSPASALVPLLRYFTPSKGSYPTNPWNASFRAGTKISAALDLASQALARSGIQHGSIVLVSDLQTAPSDLATLTQTLVRLRHDGVVVRAVPLEASDLSKEVFGSVLGPGYLLPAPRAIATKTTHIRRSIHGELSIPLVVLAGLLLVGLAANERWCARLAITESIAPKAEG